MLIEQEIVLLHGVDQSERHAPARLEPLQLVVQLGLPIFRRSEEVLLGLQQAFFQLGFVVLREHVFGRVPELLAGGAELGPFVAFV